VAEVEDVRAAARGAQNRVDAVPERIAAGGARQRIEVALRREPLRKLGQEQVRLERPVQRDRVGKAGLEPLVASRQRLDRAPPSHVPLPETCFDDIVLEILLDIGGRKS
jgi:hypothetical protein